MIRASPSGRGQIKKLPKEGGERVERQPNSIETYDIASRSQINARDFQFSKREKAARSRRKP